MTPTTPTAKWVSRQLASGVEVIRDAETHERIAEAYKAEHADLIVRAVNSHAALIEALKAARDDMARLVQAYIRDGEPTIGDKRLREIVDSWSSIRPIDAAITLAGES